MRCDRSTIVQSSHWDNSTTEVRRRTNLRGFNVMVQPNRNKADVVFTRSDGKKMYTIYAAWNKGSGWEQWGAPSDVLSDNVSEVERFFKHKRILQ